MSTPDCAWRTGRYYFRHRAAALIVEEGHVLLAHNTRDPYYYSVGGALAMDEDSATAVLREVREESGLDYEIERLAFVHELFFPATLLGPDVLAHELTFYYWLKPQGLRAVQRQSVTSDGIVEEVVWLPLSQLDQYHILPDELCHYLQTQLGPDGRPVDQSVQHFISRELLESL